MINERAVATGALGGRGGVRVRRVVVRVTVRVRRVVVRVTVRVMRVVARARAKRVRVVKVKLLFSWKIDCGVCMGGHCARVVVG